MEKISWKMGNLYDPLRKKEVVPTPEEYVRQWFIGVLSGTVGVPMHMMMSEVSLKLPSGKPQRADIVVWDRSGAPLMIVECKRPEVELTADVAAQALRYIQGLPARYIAITNGHGTYVYIKEGGVFRSCASLPTWEEMLCQP